MITAMFIFGTVIGVFACRMLMRNKPRVNRVIFSGSINASKLNK